MKQMIATLLGVALLAGCAHRDKGSFVNGEALQVGTAAESIATDATSAVVALYPPGKTSIRLLVAGSDSFSAAFEQHLRARGFSIVPSAPGTAPAGLQVSYVLDRHKTDGSLMLRLQFADDSGKRKMMRSYTAAGQAEAAFSTTGGVW
ncbi:hypothetical protein [Desulfobulbus elongatus]|uniref:hypothetical protein n=1 Tax=Desulfobulbus elongatus TaxID=53332 RepID=UPI000487EEA2|nr:hypothetical protein [Desulfobulbus elongatus]